MNVAGGRAPCILQLDAPLSYYPRATAVLRRSAGPSLYRSMKSILDVAYRLVLVLAYRITLFWRFMARRPSFGAATAVKHDGRLLLVKDSYRGIWSMPGGRIRRGEEPAAAAVRELAEETGIELRQEAIALVGVFRNAWEYGIDTVHVFEA